MATEGVVVRSCVRSSAAAIPPEPETFADVGAVVHPGWVIDPGVTAVEDERVGHAEAHAGVVRPLASQAVTARSQRTVAIDTRTHTGLVINTDHTPGWRLKFGFL